MRISRDIKSYQDVVGTFKIPALRERFEFLRQLGQIFLLPPEVLKSYITENYLGRIDSSLLRPFLAQRADWGSQSEKAFNDGAPAPPDPAGTDLRVAGVGALGSRFARLSTMMKDLETKGFEGMGFNVPALPNIGALHNISGISGLPSIATLSTGLPARYSLSGGRP
jgi:hypothetical protein